jgi:hypothetical protein
VDKDKNKETPTLTHLPRASPIYPPTLKIINTANMQLVLPSTTDFHLIELNNQLMIYIWN